ncbi:MAG TPA: hypothetical protein VH482_20975 [Thermomicrobiales bacterium]|jgi:hypothetical protein
MHAEQRPAKPVSLVLLLDLPEERLTSLVAQVAALRTMTRGFEPVFVVDTTALGAIGEVGCPVEYVMPYADWTTIQDPSRWASYLEERLNAIVRTHAPKNVLIATGEVPAEGLDLNLYGCLLRLSASAPPEPAGSPGLAAIASELASIDAKLARLADETVSSKLAPVTLSLVELSAGVAQLREKVDRLTRLVRDGQVRRPGLRQRLREAMKEAEKRAADRKADARDAKKGSR